MFTISESNLILSVLPENFNSHDFIRIGALLAPFSFLEMLREYNGDFTTIDSQIEQFLNRCSEQSTLSISKTGTTKSETIIGTTSQCATWRK